jgi:hypothetical protein
MFYNEVYGEVKSKVGFLKEDVIIYVNVFGNADLRYVADNLKRALCSVKDQLYVIVSWSNPPPNVLERLSELEKKLEGSFLIVPLLLPKMSLGKQRDVTLRYVRLSTLNTLSLWRKM